MRREKHRKACHYRTGRQTEPGRLACPVEIVKLEDESYHLLIEAEVDGISGDMIIDTGASVTVVDQQLFPGHTDGKINAEMQSGSVTGQIENIRLLRPKSFKIHGHTVNQPQMATINLNYVNDMYHKHVRRRIIGLLGSDFCVKQKAVIDYRTQEFSMNRPRKREK